MYFIITAGWPSELAAPMFAEYVSIACKDRAGQQVERRQFAVQLQMMIQTQGRLYTKCNAIAA